MREYTFTTPTRPSEKQQTEIFARIVKSGEYGHRKANDVYEVILTTEENPFAKRATLAKYFGEASVAGAEKRMEEMNRGHKRSTRKVGEPGNGYEDQ